MRCVQCMFTGYESIQNLAEHDRVSPHVGWEDSPPSVKLKKNEYLSIYQLLSQWVDWMHCDKYLIYLFFL